MPIWPDINGFPESGFPVLADVGDRICLGNLYTTPIKQSGFIIDVVGNNRLLGALTLGGALSGVTTIGASGTVTLSGATPLTLSGTAAAMSMTGDTASITMSGLNATFLMTGLNASIGKNLARIRRGYFTDLEIKNKPTVMGDEVVVQGDLARYTPTDQLPDVWEFQMLS